MRKIFIPLAIFLFVFSSTGPLMSSKDGDDSKFQKTLENYLNEHWKF